MAKRILIVEDDILVATDMELMLQSAGYKVTGKANSAAKAYELFLREIPDLILCDVNLRAKKTGIDFVAKARKRSFVPVIYITAYTDERTLSKALETDPESYLIKPFTKLQLKTSVAMALKKYKGKNKVTEEKTDFTPPSERELEILKLLCDGSKSREIAEKLFISIQTVLTHRKNLMAKLKVNNAIDLVNMAQKNNLCD